jgi:hypothetical protein
LINVTIPQSNVGLHQIKIYTDGGSLYAPKYNYTSYAEQAAADFSIVDPASVSTTVAIASVESFPDIPNITLGGDSGMVGSVTTISGNNFTKNDYCYIFFDQILISNGCKVDANGLVLINVTIPQSNVGLHQIKIYTDGGSLYAPKFNYTSYAEQAAADFTIKGSTVVTTKVPTATKTSLSKNPGLVLNKNSGTVGSNITITGSNFTFNNYCYIFFDQTPISTGGRVDSSGSFSISVTIPQSATGAHQIKVISSSYSTNTLKYDTTNYDEAAVANFSIVNSTSPSATVPSSSIPVSTAISPKNITISASAGNHGSLSPDGILTLSQGTNQTFSISPDTGYQIASILVDGDLVELANSYTFSNISSDHSINVTFSGNQANQDPLTSTNITNMYTTIASAPKVTSDNILSSDNNDISSSDSNSKWTIIGSLAGIIGALGTIIALFKRRDG